MASSEKRPKKNVPTILPTGFGIRVTDKKMFILDFADTDYDNNATIVGSFAMDEKTVGMLVSKLNQAVDEANKKNE